MAQFFIICMFLLAILGISPAQNLRSTKDGCVLQQVTKHCDYIIMLIIHQIFSLMHDWSKHVM